MADNSESPVDADRPTVLVTPTQILAEKQPEKEETTENSGTEGAITYMNGDELYEDISLDEKEADDSEKNSETVEQFFTNLRYAYDNVYLTPDRIFSVGEIFITKQTVERSNIVCCQPDQLKQLVNGDVNGSVVTVLTCISSSGAHMPPLFVFPLKTSSPELLEEAPPCSTGIFHPSGMIQPNIFFRWFQYFVTYARPTKERPVLLVFDGFDSRIENIALLEEARKAHVILISFPPSLAPQQPIQVSLVPTIKKYYAKMFNEWQKRAPCGQPTLTDISRIFSASYMRAASVKNAINGFSKTGIYPLNAKLLLRGPTPPLPDTEKRLPYCDMYPDVETSDTNCPTKNSEKFDKCTMTDHLDSHVQKKETLDAEVQTESFVKTFTAPDTTFVNDHSSEAAGRQSVKVAENCLSGTEGGSIHNDAVRRAFKRPKVLKKSVKRTKGRNVKSQPKGRRRLEDSPLRTSPVGIGTGEDARCVYCSYLYSQSKAGENWIQCVFCQKWAHEACTSYEGGSDFFTCDYCAYPAKM